MSNTLDIYYKKIDALDLRGQFIFLIISLLIIYFIWNTLLFSPAQQKKMDLQNQTEQAKSRIMELDGQLKQREKEIKNMPLLGPNAVEKPTLQTNKIIPMMTELMNKQPGLELISISTRPPEPIKLDDVVSSRINPNQAEAAKIAANKENQPKDSSNAPAGLFRHAITLQFRGDYFSTLQFLEKIESLPWLLVHDDIVYSVATYPQANVTLQLNLLSLAGGII